MFAFVEIRVYNPVRVEAGATAVAQSGQFSKSDREKQTGMARVSICLAFSLFLIASLLVSLLPVTVFADIHSITLTLEGPDPQPVQARIDTGKTSSYFIYLDNPDSRFYIYRIDLEASCASDDEMGVRVYDSAGALREDSMIGGNRTLPFRAELRPARSQADFSGWQFLVLLDNRENGDSHTAHLDLRGHASTALRGEVSFEDGSPMAGAGVEVRCSDSGERMYVTTESDGSYTVDRCPLGSLEASVSWLGNWRPVWPGRDLSECVDCGLAYTGWDLSTSHPPPETISTPNAPLGPSTGVAGASLTYTTGGASSNLGHSLDYRFDWGNGTYSMWSSSNASTYAWPEAGTYQVRAQARCAEHAGVVSDWSDAREVSIFEPPETVSVPDVPLGPAKAEVGVSLTFLTGGSHSNLDHSLQYRFDWGDGSQSEWMAATSASHVWMSAGTYDVKARARCGSHVNVMSTWSGPATVTIGQPPETLSPPSVPVGPATGEVGKALGYSTGGAVSSLGNSVQYRFDWGDGTRSEWSAALTASKSWSSQGPFKVRAQARSAADSGVVSLWSVPATVNIAPPPEVVTTPSVPSGPDSGEIGESLTYTAQGASSNLQHRLQYRLDWGDGTQSDWSLSATASHTWQGAGAYNVRTQARCATHNDVMSEWSPARILTITRPPESVSAPDVPGGPSAAEVGLSLTYTTGGALSSLGHGVEYRFDWGDGTRSDWSPSVSASKSWDSPGTYEVRAQARSSASPAVVSTWSEVRAVTLYPPPETVTTPRTPTGPASTGAGGDATYETGGAASSLNNPVEYRFDWGDGTRSEWSDIPQGNHSWSAQGPYNVRAQARSAVRRDVVSGWSGGWMVVVSPEPETVDAPDAPMGPGTALAGRDVVVSSGGAGSSTGRSVEYRFDWGDGTYSDWSPDPRVKHSWSRPGTYVVRAAARSVANPNAVSVWSPTKVVIVEAPPEEVSVPNAPVGPSANEVGVELSFLTGGARSSLGSDVEYRFDWGDRTTSVWSASGKASHEWNSAGKFIVRAQARSAEDRSVVSDWSGAKSVMISPPTNEGIGPAGSLDISHRLNDSGAIDQSVEVGAGNGKARLKLLQGTVATTSGGAPVGALELQPVEQPPSAPRGYALMGGPVRLGPSEAVFTPPAIMMIEYDYAEEPENEPGVNSGAGFALGRYDPDRRQWVRLESIVDAESRTVMAEVEAAGLYAVLDYGSGSPGASVKWILTGVIIGATLLIGLITFLWLTRREELALVMARARDVVLRRQGELPPDEY